MTCMKRSRFAEGQTVRIEPESPSAPRRGRVWRHTWRSDFAALARDWNSHAPELLRCDSGFVPDELRIESGVELVEAAGIELPAPFS